MARRTLPQPPATPQSKLELQRVEQMLEHFAAESEYPVAAGTPRCFTEPELFDPANWAEGEVRGDPKVVAKFRKAAQAEAAKKRTKKTQAKS